MDNINLTRPLGNDGFKQAHKRVHGMLKSPTDLRVPVKRAATHPQIKQHKQNQQKQNQQKQQSLSNDTNSNDSQPNDSNSDDDDDGGGDDDSDRQGSKHSQSLKYQYQYQARPQLPQQGFLRLREILQVIPVSKSTWWAGVKSGRYPQPVRSLGKRITAWRVEEIQSLINDAF